MSSLEYRVWWRREGCQRATRIYQTEDAARHKADGILALDAVKHVTRFADMPDLVEGPVIEIRDVTPWREHDRVTEPSDEACARMEEWGTPYQDTVESAGVW